MLQGSRWIDRSSEYVAVKKMTAYWGNFLRQYIGAIRSSSLQSQEEKPRTNISTKHNSVMYNLCNSTVDKSKKTVFNGKGTYVCTWKLMLSLRPVDGVDINAFLDHLPQWAVANLVT